MQALNWPTSAPAHGAVRLRGFEDRDVPMVRDLATDPYVPTIGSLPANASEPEALAYIARQRTRLPEDIGFSFCVADRDTGVALGDAGLWVHGLSHGRSSVGYSIAPEARGHGAASDGLHALVEFAWTLADLHRLEARIEPWNTASVRTAESAGFVREGLLRSHEEIGGRRADVLMYSLLRPPSDGEFAERR